MQYSLRARVFDRIARILFFVCAILLIVVIVAVIVFIGSKAFSVFFEPHGANVFSFFFTDKWDPTGANDPSGNAVGAFGAGGLLLGSIVTTLGAIIIVTPLALGSAIFFTEVAPKWLTRLLSPLIEIFTGIPSVIVGVLGLIILVPFLTRLAAPITNNLPTAGYGWGAAILVLVVMVVPTVISVSIDALRAVPGSVREASLAMGATPWQTMSRAIIPAAASGLGTAIVLGMTRAIGETLAVALVLQGNSLPQNLFSLAALFQPNVNVTMEIARDFGETSGVAQDAYWTLAFVLLVISFIFICISRYLASRSVYN